MSDDSQVEAMLEELLNSGGTPEVVCRACPDLLPQVRAGWQRCVPSRPRSARGFPKNPPTWASSPARATPPPPPASNELPHIAGYELRRVLGRGGMGVVYKARHLQLNRPVALKMLLAGAYARPEELERFLREAEAVAGLRHANIVQVYDVGNLDGRPYFTMEFVEGGSLAQQVAGTPQPAGRAAAMVAAIAEAIQVAHQSGIVHRDLKPANILLTADGTPKITDFGVARRLQDAGGLTVTGATVGTPSYMAPEQAQGPRERVGPAADVYALGAILYELLTGRPPFQADTPSATLQQVLTEDPVPPSRLNPRTPRDLQTICLKCLQKEPHRRYASAADLADDLRRFERGEPIAARPIGPAVRLMQWARRCPTAAALSGALLTATLLALALVGGALWLSGQRSADVRAAEDDLREAIRLQEKSDLPAARAALERAKGRLGANGPDELQQRVEQASRNLDLVARLHAIRLDRAVVVAGRFNRGQSDRRYAAAFHEAGLGTVNDDAKAVAARVNASPVRGSLVAALDDWSVCAADTRRRDWVLAVARLADPDPWRDCVRDPADWKNRRHLQELARTAPLTEQSLQLLVALGERLQANHGDAVALPYLRRVQQAYPTDFYANFMLGNALRTLGQPAEAVGYFRAALAVRPDTVAAYYALGKALQQQGRLDEAIAAFERGLERDPLSGWTHAALGEILLAKKRADEAIDHYERALRLSEPTTSFHINLAVALEQKSRLDEAIAHYRAALALDARSSAAHYNLARALNVRGKHDEAIDHLKKSIASDPNHGSAHYTLGLFLKDRGRLDEAIGEFRRAATLDPTYAPAHEELRALLIRQGRLEEARAAWRKAMDGAPRDHGVWFGYAELCLFLGKEDEYRRARRALLSRFDATTDRGVAERVGRACLLLPATPDVVADAGALVNRALAGGPEGWEWAYSYFLFAHGLAEYRRGRLDSAMAIMGGEASHVLGPAPRLVTAMALHRQGKVELARKTLAAAVLAYDWRAEKADSRDHWIAHVLRREAEALILPDLPAFLRGEYQPRDNDERLALLGHCQFERLHAARARLYTGAFMADPKLADDLQAGHRYRAACAAAIAGCGGGADGVKLSAEERSQLRSQARAWLRADLDAWARKVASAPPAERGRAQRALSGRLTDPALAGLRDPDGLARLSAAEREECLALWRDVQTQITRDSAATGPSPR